MLKVPRVQGNRAHTRRIGLQVFSKIVIFHSRTILARCSLIEGKHPQNILFSSPNIYQTIIKTKVVDEVSRRGDYEDY
jgi:hypothetical protein